MITREIFLRNNVIFVNRLQLGFWGTECPILFLVLVVRNCTIYVHKINQRKVYVPTLSSDYEIRIKYKHNIVDSF